MTTRAMAMRMTDENDCGSMRISVLEELIRKRNEGRAPAQKLLLRGKQADLAQGPESDDKKQEAASRHGE